LAIVKIYIYLYFQIVICHLLSSDFTQNRRTLAAFGKKSVS